MKKDNERFQQAKRNIRNLISYATGYCKIELEKPSPAQLHDNRRRTNITVAVIAGIAALTIHGLQWYRYYNTILNTKIDISNWLAFISVYWGGIIGAILAGIITIISTAMIIQRSYRIDYHRERLEHMPFLSITYFKQYDNDFDKHNECYIIDNYYNKQASILKIKNVGRGIAINIKTEGFTDDHLEAIIPTLVVNEAKYLIGYISVDRSNYEQNSEGVFDYNFTIKYSDIFENEYEQMFRVELFGEKMVFINSIPELVKKTMRYRYVQ